MGRVRNRQSSQVKMRSHCPNGEVVGDEVATGTTVLGVLSVFGHAAARMAVVLDARQRTARGAHRLVLWRRESSSAMALTPLEA